MLMLRYSKSLSKIGLAAVIGFVLLQFVAFSHALTADHGLDDRCQICLVAERSDDEGSPPANAWVAQAANTFDVTAAPNGYVEDPSLTRHRARGPPAP